MWKKNPSLTHCVTAGNILEIVLKWICIEHLLRLLKFIYTIRPKRSAETLCPCYNSQKNTITRWLELFWLTCQVPKAIAGAFRPLDNVNNPSSMVKHADRLDRMERMTSMGRLFYVWGENKTQSESVCRLTVTTYPTPGATFCTIYTFVLISQALRHNARICTCVCQRSAVRKTVFHARPRDSSVHVSVTGKLPSISPFLLLSSVYSLFFSINHGAAPGISEQCGPVTTYFCLDKLDPGLKVSDLEVVYTVTCSPSSPSLTLRHAPLPSEHRR